MIEGMRTATVASIIMSLTSIGLSLASCYYARKARRYREESERLQRLP